MKNRDMFTRRGNAGLPVICIVDAFVGALSVVLILTILSSPNRNWEANRPQTMVEINCKNEENQLVLWLSGEEKFPFTADSLIEKLDSATSPEALSLRVRLKIPYTQNECALNVRELIRKENIEKDTIKTGRKASQSPVYLLDVVYTEEAVN
jgi:hypothetical protein